MVARCRFEEARASGVAPEERWRAIVAILSDSIQETDSKGLPRGVIPVDPALLGQAVNEVALLASRRDDPDDVLAIIKAHAGNAEYPATLQVLEGEANLALGRWPEAAVLLESAGSVDSLDRAENARALRLASGAWRAAGQPEKALVTFTRAQRMSPAGFEYPDRLIPDGEEIDRPLWQLIAASVHGVLVQCFERDYDALQAKPAAFNFFVDKREKDLLEAADEVASLEKIVKAPSDAQTGQVARQMLYQILNMRGLVHAAGGDVHAGRQDMKLASTFVDVSSETDANMAILAFWPW